MNFEERQKEITSLVEKYYNDNSFLQREPIDIIINRALDMFLGTDFSIEEIDEKLAKAVELEKEEFERDQEELNEMINSEKEKVNESSSNSKNESKQIQKSNNHNILDEDGYTTGYTVLFCLLIVITLTIGCFALLVH